MAAAGPLLDSFWQSLLTLVFFYAFMGLTWNLMMSAAHGQALGYAALLDAPHQQFVHAQPLTEDDHLGAGLLEEFLQ